MHCVLCVLVRATTPLSPVSLTRPRPQPANVLITSQYDAKITDFGISILNDDSASSKRKQPKEALEGTTLCTR